jgi:hypothetical protein
MKIKTSLFAFVLFLLAAVAGCKKDSSDQMKNRVIGKWTVSKVEPAPVLNITSGDYYDFKAGEDDIVEVRRAGSLESGTYNVTAGEELNFVLGDKLYQCTIDVLDANKFEFTAKQGNTTEKVYLKR